MADEADTIVEQEDIATDEAPEVVEQVELSDVDKLAMELGWRPKSEWSGAEEEWADSSSFLRKTREINRSQAKELKDIKKQVEGIGRATAAMTERALKEERKRLEAERDEAIELGDKQAVREYDKALNELPNKPAEQSISDEGRAFAERHSSWFGKDAEATTYAANRAQYYADQGLSPARQLSAVEKDMKDLFPDLFPKKEEPRKPPALSRPQGGASSTPREKGYATLPAEARKACDQWVASMKENGHAWADSKTWAANYYSQEATNG